jgi:hypothetical protein
MIDNSLLRETAPKAATLALNQWLLHQLGLTTVHLIQEQNI